MRQLIILWMIVMLQHSTGAQYPDCVSCSDGSIPLSPLSYNTMRSNVFNGTQPSNEGCTNGVSIDGRVTIDCGQQTTLIDCDRGFNGGNYSDLSRTFAWNRTTSVAQQVSIVFRFDQQINISRITMFFWNSQSNSIIIPNVRMYWSNDDSITPSNEITITTNSPSRTGDGRRRMNIDINDNGLQFQYLRIEMSFYDDSEWIFLSEVQFCGNTAPYNITQPSTDNDVQIVSPTATMTSITCSLNITIPSTMNVTWSHNTSLITDLSQITTTGSTTTLLIENLQPSDAGVYQCVFNDTAGYVLRRRTTLLIIDLQFVQPPVDLFTVTFNESSNSVPLTCQLNINIPSSVTVMWILDGTGFMITPPNEVIRDDSTVTLLINNPQPSDTGDYQCLFVGLSVPQRVIVLEFQNTTAISTSMTLVTGTTSLITEVTPPTVSMTESVSTMAATSSGVLPIQSTTVVTQTSTVSLADSSIIITTTSIALSSMDVVTSSTSTTNVLMPGENSGSDGGSNVGAIVAPIIIILILVIVIIVLVVGFFVWRRRQHKYNTAHSETYYSSVNETKLKSLTVDSNTLNSHFGGPLNSDSTRSTAPIYSVPRRDSKREPKSVEKTQSTVSNQSSPPIIPDRTSKYDECVENSLYGKPPNGIMETDGESIDDEVLDDSFDEDENLTPLHSSKKGVSPRRGKSKSPSKTPTKKAKQPSSSSTQSSLLSPLKSFGSHSSGVDNVSVEGDKTLKGLHSSMQPNPLYASSQSLSKLGDKNIELNIYDSIQSPKHNDLAFTESIYSEIAEPNTLITTETPQVDSVKDVKDLYPYSSIYAEPLPLDKSESPPLVTSQNVAEVQLLGTGQFGEVVLANTVGLSKFYLQLGASEDCSISLKVAVKKLKLNSTKEMQQAFEKEIKFMSRLKDNNVIRLLGICTTGTPFIMMEYMENGDLNQYLQRFELLLDPDEAPSENQITPITLIYMAYQIASGMKYLSSLKYVHRDLATRNILVGKDYVVKIADFGMSQNLYSAYYFKVKGRAILPIRWMAYECFFGKFSVKTDVWAYGITLWEIFTLAKQQPYHNMEDQEVIDSALKGEGRLLMIKPENCPDEIYEVMLRCLVHDPSKRATFAELYETLKEINNRQ